MRCSPRICWKRKVFTHTTVQACRWRVLPGLPAALSPSVFLKRSRCGHATCGSKHVYQGTANKLAAIHEILEKDDLSMEQVAYLGDDVIDLPVLRVCGLAMAVADARPQVRARGPLDRAFKQAAAAPRGMPSSSSSPHRESWSPRSKSTSASAVDEAHGLTKPCAAGQNRDCTPPQCGPVAQLGARFHGMEEVIGSIPIRSTKSCCHRGLKKSPGFCEKGSPATMFEVTVDAGFSSGHYLRNYRGKCAKSSRSQTTRCV